MRHNTANLFWAPLWIGCALACSLEAQVQTKAPLTAAVAAAPQKLGSVLESAMKGHPVPGLAALVLSEGRVAEVAARGLRQSGGKDPVTSEDVWVIGSTGKPMTVAAIARLVERRVLAWDQTLVQLLPDLATQMRAEYRNVTLLQLLSHRSGLPENLKDEKALEAYFTDTRALAAQRDALTKAALQEAPVPSEGFAYCNTGFIVAASIAERKTGIPFETLVHREVFEPLAMASAGFGAPGVQQPVGHQKGRPMMNAVHLDDGVPAMYGPAGFMHMSLRDWAKFCIDQLQGAQGKGKLLKAETYRLMQAAQPGSPAGVDWGVQAAMGGRRGPVLVHGGSDGNWLAWVVLFPEQQSGALVVANAAEDMGADKVEHAVLGALLPRLAPAQ